MKLIVFLFFLSLFCLYSLGQTKIYDSNQIMLNYPSTDFNKIDTLEYWNYKLDLKYKSTETDMVKPIGLLTFSRIKSIDDSINLKVYNKPWKPMISFEIYKLSDTTFCSKKSNLIHVLSSCTPPNVGGDCFIFGNFIFLNKNECVSCSDYVTKVDYCRPVINYAFMSVKNRNVKNLNDLVTQFKIKSGL